MTTYKVVPVKGKSGADAITPLGRTAFVKNLEPELAARYAYPEIWHAEAECLEGNLYEVSNTATGEVVGWCLVTKCNKTS